jgi:hypothetical protein
MTEAPTASESANAPASASRRASKRRVGLAALALAVVVLSTTQVTITGGLYGVYLLDRPAGRPFEIKDDLRLGDGPRLIAGITFGPIHDLVHSVGTLPRLRLDWDEAEGGGVVRNFLQDGTELQTLFGRYVDDDGKTPRGLFVGGAIADVAASRAQSQSGMALRDAQGWHHIWCTVNEGLADGGSTQVIPPGEWTFLGSRVLVEAADRVVLQSEHEVRLRDTTLRIERNAYFTAGRTFLRLGINLTNIGDRPATVTYIYGDEPWVGEFGSAEGNLGWTEAGILPVATPIDPHGNKWAGIIDTKTGFANFLSWAGTLPPSLAFVANHGGTPKPSELYKPLQSNEIFVGLEWRDREIAPGETLGLRLSIGLAVIRPDGRPTVPPEVLTSR